MGTCEGRVALVTGGSRGIGKALARRLSAEGAAVVVSASRLGARKDFEGSLEETVAAIESAGGRAAAEAGNLAREEERADLVDRAVAHFGPIDILVNNAAMGAWGLPSQSALSDRRKMLEVNYHAPIDLAQGVIPSMRERGEGWILNISSNTVEQPAPPYRDTPEAAHLIVAYGSTKSALERYSLGLAHELHGTGIRVNCLAPVSILLTQEAARFVGHIARANSDMVEPIETMVEAAMALCEGTHNGQNVYSRGFLHAIGRPVRSLDGKSIVGDAFMPADLDQVVS